MDTTSILRRWWLPSSILILAIFLTGLLLPNLIYPNQPPQGGDSPRQAAAVTFTATPELTKVVAVGATPFAVTSEVEVNNTPITSENNCTYTIYYWKDHPESWLTDNILINQLSYTKVQAISILRAETDDATNLLLKQFMVSLLNFLKGADPSLIQAEVMQASNWLSTHTIGAIISENDRAVALELAKILEDYNTGVIGPGACADEPIPPTPTHTATPTETPTPEPTKAPPTVVFSPTPIPGSGGNGNPQPTDTSVPTTAPTVAQTEAPTEVIQPTDTLAPPTEASPPTPLPPTDTPLPPPPTSAPTEAPTSAPLSTSAGTGTP